MNLKHPVQKVEADSYGYINYMLRVRNNYCDDLSIYLSFQEVNDVNENRYAGLSPVLQFPASLLARRAHLIGQQDLRQQVLIVCVGVLQIRVRFLQFRLTEFHDRA